MVYTAEAHAQDEWPVASARYNGNRGIVRVRQPKTVIARCKLARQFVEDFKIQMPCAIDPPLPPRGKGGNDKETFVPEGDLFMKHFAPWPLRFFVVEKDSTADVLRLTYKASPSGATYDPAHLFSWLWRRVLPAQQVQ